ncbi:restriction endonuclease subunit S [Fenollaria massiliensis]|uniref:Restriction endonuclease subunit S n=1 Tax=Fenollaria massiliensis TaxID=938288 RepID=A0A9E7DJE4_9FIRM|nr:restriction endonuclease subunit S [Fenollaria massiliensis]UQK59016.1 restriction endonuclease subunit S [Fenollaria massiliensis]
MIKKRLIYIYIYIRVRELFDIQRGKAIYTKTYCKNHKGEYPVFSADNNKPLAFRDDYDYDGKYLTSSVNGLAGILTIIDGKFSATADRVIFIPKLEDINLHYVKNILEPILRNKIKGRMGLMGKNEFTKLNPRMIENELIPIPFNSYGEPFLEKQFMISNKFNTVENIKKKIYDGLNELLDTEILF